jgi:hypothetical protein
MGMRKLDIYHRRKNLDLISHHKQNKLKYKHKYKTRNYGTTKRKPREMCHDMGMSKDLRGKAPKTQETKAKIGK